MAKSEEVAKLLVEIKARIEEFEKTLESDDISSDAEEEVILFLRQCIELTNVLNGWRNFVNKTEEYNKRCEDLPEGSCLFERLAKKFGIEVSPGAIVEMQAAERRIRSRKP